MIWKTWKQSSISNKVRYIKAVLFRRTVRFEASYSNLSGCAKRGRMYEGKTKFISRSKTDKAVANQKTKRQEDKPFKKTLHKN